MTEKTKIIKGLVNDLLNEADSSGVLFPQDNQRNYKNDWDYLVREAERGDLQAYYRICVTIVTLLICYNAFERTAKASTAKVDIYADAYAGYCQQDSYSVKLTGYTHIVIDKIGRCKYTGGINLRVDDQLILKLDSIPVDEILSAIMEADFTADIRLPGSNLNAQTLLHGKAKQIAEQLTTLFISEINS